MSLAGVLAGCGASQSTSKATSSSTSAKSTKTQTKRQRLISALPKGVKSTDSDLVVVNKWHKRAEMTFNKSSVDGIEVRSSIVKPLEAFLAGAKKAGYPATIVSGYRSVAYQKEVWNQSIQTYEN
ncbi:D-alanyl-D-alanine carboxypeptidase family protein, partial [Lactiplantibacillus plantarum]